MRLSRLSAPVAATAMLLALAGCGGGDSATEAEGPDESARVAVQRVAENTRNVDSASYTFSLAGTGALAIGAKGSGAYQTKPELAMKMVFDEFKVAGQPIAGGMEQRIVGDTMYLRMGMLGKLMGGGSGDSWVKIPLSSADGKGLASVLSQSQQVNPREQLQLLVASDNVQEVGKEKVNGIDTTHYAAELDADDLANASELDAATREQLQKAYGAAGVGTIGVDVWVDSDDQARRFVTLAPTAAGDVRMTLDFTDYGKDLDITAPEGARDAGVDGLLDNLTHSDEAREPTSS